MLITGIGWVGTATHGAVRLGRSGAHHDGRDLYRQLRADGVVPDAIKDFGRFDPDSVRVCLAAALTLHDAGIAPWSDAAGVTGLLIAGATGSQTANLAYFRDYIVNGRSLGRGNLFIYTLPTSPAAEASICFGLSGPLLYIGHGGRTAAADALRAAADFVAAGQADTMLCVVADDAQTISYALQAPGGGRQGWPLEAMLQADGTLASPEHLMEGPA